MYYYRYRGIITVDDIHGNEFEAINDFLINNDNGPILKIHASGDSSPGLQGLVKKYLGNKLKDSRKKHFTRDINIVVAMNEALDSGISQEKAAESIYEKFPPLECDSLLKAYQRINKDVASKDYRLQPQIELYEIHLND